MSFWDSELIKNFTKGKLPTVDTNVEFDRKSTMETVFIVVIAATVIIVTFFCIRKLAQ